MIDRDYWRSLEQRSQVQAPGQTSASPEPQQLALLEAFERRELFKYAGASMALAGLVACSVQPEELIHAYAKNPEALLPGKPLYFATAMSWPTGGIALLAESHMGRPTKLEGNPEHASSRGATDVFAQASVLTLYDPDRSQVIKRNGRISTWQVFSEHLGPVMETYKGTQGAGLRLLTETVVSPALARQLQKLTSDLPKAIWHQYEPVHRENSRRGAEMAFGADQRVVVDFEQADVIVALESDFLGAGPASVPLARAFAARRRGQAGKASMNRLYAVESSPTVTGSTADHRLALSPAEIEHFVRALAKAVGVTPAVGAHQALAAAWMAPLLADLQARSGRVALLVGEALSPSAHALVHAIHAKLGAIGKGVQLHPALGYDSTSANSSIQALAEDMARGDKVETLVILGANPVYDAPAELNFKAELGKVPQVIHHGLYEDETGEASHWHIPEAHFLEAWGDALASDGSLLLVQPLILPLYEGKSKLEVLAALQGQTAAKGYDLLREVWKERLGETDFEIHWRRAVHDGFQPETASKAVSATLKNFQATDAAAPVELELALRPDTSTFDGRFANNGWLQELPRPLTKVVWENPLHVAPSTASARGWSNGDRVRISAGGRSIEALVWVQPGQAAQAATLHLGYGRTVAGRLGTGVGCNAYALRTSAMPWNLATASFEALGQNTPVVSAQEHHDMEGRDLIRELSAADYASGKTGVPEHAIATEGTNFYKDFAYDGAAWGMVIDLSACTGCSACVIACQSENNISVVGKDEVGRGREMHWIRIDRYFKGEEGAPEVRFQPITCMQCEKAPCEVVCPVGATVHGPEGLNDMVYNRCIGTRYCSNNCPYKVRRFNFLLYSDFETESLKMQRNPDVTVRSRGVMEKCTYCVQRINEARLAAKKDNRKVRDGEIVTACQQVCPSEAIVFGDINDPASRIAARRKEQHNYPLLEELNTRPRTTYLARVHNQNHQMPGAQAAGAEK